MATTDKTLYEVLGVSRNAKLTDITRAYARVRSELQREDVAPNPRLAAMAKVACETLSDPAKRAAYDETLPLIGLPASKPKPRARGKSRAGLAAAFVFLGLVAAGAGWYFLEYRPAARSSQRPAEKALSGVRIAERVAPHLGRVQGALMSGETRELGLALALDENQMVTTCRGIVAGLVLSVKVGAASAKAEVARANEELDVCILDVRGASSDIKVRPGAPAANEPLQAIVLGATGAAKPLQVTVARPIPDPKGQALEIKAGAPLPNGTPIFDSQARLVGLVTTPHGFGDGVVAALGASRIVSARPAATTLAAGSASSATPAAPSVAAASTQAPAPLPAPATRRGSRGTMISEGFTSLWREDEDGRLIEVMDNPGVGDIGNPLAYWMLWEGRDESRPQVVHCRVTQASTGNAIADYDLAHVDHPPEGYWYCAITRFTTDLDLVPAGEYLFEIFVDGGKIGERSIRIERRFFTPTAKIVIVLLIGMGLLAFLRRGKARR